MVVSLVNPHDVLFYPEDVRERRATTTPGSRARSSLPATVDEDLSTKPTRAGAVPADLQPGGPHPDARR